MRRDLKVWIEALKKYVSGYMKPEYARVIRRITLKHSKRAEVNNQRQARSFCYVHLNGDPVIYYAEALECLDLEFIIAILLHEIAHIVVKTGPVDDEVDADQWIVDAFPLAKYHYEDTCYTSPWTGRMRTAKNLQCVSRDFIRRLS